jgi:hypothetical protein
MMTLVLQQPYRILVMVEFIIKQQMQMINLINI